MASPTSPAIDTPALPPTNTPSTSANPSPSPLPTNAPYRRKTGATLDLLLSLRGQDQVPADLRPILAGDTVSVSINFSHELANSEIQALEAAGLRFVRINGQVAHSGTIYGAELPWDAVEDLLLLDSVIRVESTWQPGMHSPEN